MNNHRVFAGRLAGETHRRVAEALDWIDWTSVVAPGARVFIKPNFTYPFYKPGVTTSPALIEAVVRVLSDRAGEIVICESNGGSDAWSADRAFEGHDLPSICARHGARTMNLTEAPREIVEATVGGRRVSVELPAPLVHDADVFVTMPVPKIHMMTGVSLGFKNQWGCLPDVKRLRRHHEFSRAVLAINKILKPALAVFDGTYFLNRTGPMDGDAIPMDLVVASRGPGPGTLACCDIMQIDWRSIAHLRDAAAEGMMPDDVAALECNAPLASFRRQPFTLERTPLNWFSLLGFRNRFLAWLLWDSALARPAHEVLYLLRGRPTDFRPQW
jgi:uncharacterized protein (DUF362 family)